MASWAQSKVFTEGMTQLVPSRNKNPMSPSSIMISGQEGHESQVVPYEGHWNGTRGDSSPSWPLFLPCPPSSSRKGRQVLVICGTETTPPYFLLPPYFLPLKTQSFFGHLTYMLTSLPAVVNLLLLLIQCVLPSPHPSTQYCPVTPLMSPFHPTTLLSFEIGSSPSIGIPNPLWIPCGIPLLAMAWAKKAKNPLPPPPGPSNGTEIHCASWFPLPPTHFNWLYMLLSGYNSLRQVSKPEKNNSGTDCKM